MSTNIKLREINKKLVYRTLLRQEEMTKLELAYKTGLSLPTVAQNLKDLESEGLVSRTGVLESTGGRRAEGFCCLKNAGYAIGIDITENHITIALVNVASEIVFISDREKFSFSDTKACFQGIMKRLNAIMEEHKVTDDKLLGVGLSVPCIVDRNNNRSTYSEIIESPDKVTALLSERFPGKVELFNDANAAGYAEMWEKDGPDYGKGMLFYLMLSNSVGGSTVYHSEIYLGDSYRSSEIGHMRIVPRGKQCYCGQKGCVNAYCSAKLLSDCTNGNLSLFFDKVESGDKACRAAFTEYLNHLALAVVNLRMLYDCDIILGGYAGGYMEKYMDRLRIMVAELNPYETDGDYLIPCEFRMNASVVGAALYFIGSFISP